MDELWFRLLSGMTGGGIDLAAVLAFIAAAVLYFLAPVVGYRADRRSALALAMYALIGYAGLALLQLFIQYTSILEKGPASGITRGDTGLHLLFAFVMLKMIAFIAAMILLVVGLQSLRLRIPLEVDERWRIEERPCG